MDLDWPTDEFKGEHWNNTYVRFDCTLNPDADMCALQHSAVDIEEHQARMVMGMFLDDNTNSDEEAQEELMK